MFSPGCIFVHDLSRYRPTSFFMYQCSSAKQLFMLTQNCERCIVKKQNISMFFWKINNNTDVVKHCMRSGAQYWEQFNSVKVVECILVPILSGHKDTEKFNISLGQYADTSTFDWRFDWIVEKINKTCQIRGFSLHYLCFSNGVLCLGGQPNSPPPQTSSILQGLGCMHGFGRFSQ